ncbi:hypothetical protein, partial [uncultured Nostoc sp.]|uniref:hypothetical protein n=1 Tax=uncultured Nostoc sp. TaxID=340711 RepID=UPI0035C9458B
MGTVWVHKTSLDLAEASIRATYSTLQVNEVHPSLAWGYGELPPLKQFAFSPIRNYVLRREFSAKFLLLGSPQEEELCKTDTDPKRAACLAGDLNPQSSLIPPFIGGKRNLVPSPIHTYGVHTSTI